MLAAILIIVCSLVVWILYHKMFDVIYFDFANGCFKEILICCIIGTVLAFGIMTFWYVTIPLAIVILIMLYKRNK